MKKLIRKSILGIISLMPIQALGFASDFSSIFLSDIYEDSAPNTANQEYEKELVRRLEEGTLSHKYYDFMEKHRIHSTDDLLSSRSQKNLKKLTREFIKDIHEPLLASKNVILSENLSDAWPKKK